MKKWYYIVAVVLLSVLATGCSPSPDSPWLDNPGTDVNPPPKIDPPVDELIKVDLEKYAITNDKMKSPQKNTNAND